jgi:hypothetical protein
MARRYGLRLDSDWGGRGGPAHGPASHTERTGASACACRRLGTVYPVESASHYSTDYISLWCHIALMPWQVELHDELIPEVDDLPTEVQKSLAAHVRLLVEFGPGLGRPSVDTLKGSRIANLKEHRFSAEGGVWRVAFAFDRNRIAVLLVAGDKRGLAEGRFYKALVTKAEARWKTRGG